MASKNTDDSTMDDWTGLVKADPIKDKNETKASAPTSKHTRTIPMKHLLVILQCLERCDAVLLKKKLAKDGLARSAISESKEFVMGALLDE